MGFSAAVANAQASEAAFFAATNAARAKAGVPPLALDGELISVARAWSRTMATVGALSHNPSLATLIGDWSVIGENVGMGADVASIQRAFEASPLHLDNILRPDFQFVGVGVVEAGGSVWVTLDFKRARGAGVPRQAAPPATSARAPSAPPPVPATATHPTTVTTARRPPPPPPPGPAPTVPPVTAAAPTTTAAAAVRAVEVSSALAAPAPSHGHGSGRGWPASVVSLRSVPALAALVLASTAAGWGWRRRKKAIEAAGA